MSDNNLSAFINPSHRLKYPFKAFVKSQNLDNTVDSPVKLNTTSSNDASTGDEVKLFYETVISSSSSEKHCQVPNEKCIRPNINKSKKVFSYKNCKEKHKLTKKEILLAIESDNVNVLHQAFDQGWQEEIINCKDQFGWTPLMIAACAGALQTFKILLEKGADVNVKDKSGYTCISLAHKNNQSEIIDYINSFTSNSFNQNKHSAETVNESSNPAYDGKCDLCAVVFKSHRLMKQHFTSTVHLLNVQRKEISENGGNPKVHYSIPHSNRGFQIMLSNGWDSNVGLGPSGKGKLYPIKTVLKRDRNGLGLHKDDTSDKRTISKIAKVTHFGPYDASSVIINDESKTKNKLLDTSSHKSQEKKKSKNRAKEINFRRQFMTL